MSDHSEHQATHAAATAQVLRRRLATDGSLWLEVGGRSMWPTIRPPARVQLTPSAGPRAGEVWAFVADDGSVVVHRYERPYGDGHLFRGDGARRPDRPVVLDRLVGRVVEVDDARGRRPLGPADRAVGRVRTVVGRLRNARFRHRNWAGRLIPEKQSRR